MRLPGNLYNESHWLRLLAGGDETAFRQVFDHYKNKVYSFALAVTRSVPLAEEIVQETFVKLWLHRKELPDIQKFENWLFTITRNLCYSSLRKIAIERKAMRRLETSTDMDVLSAEEIAITRQNRELVQAAIKNLPEQQRRVYLLSKEEGLTYDQIAGQLNISRNTVKEHMSRAVAAIRAYLKMRLVLTIIFTTLLINH